MAKVFALICCGALALVLMVELIAYWFRLDGRPLEDDDGECDD